MSSAVLSGNPYRNFVESIISPYTRSAYKNTLKNYMIFRKINDCSLLLKGDPQLIQSWLIDYAIYLREEKGLISKSINTKLAALRKFYDCNDMELKWKKIKMYIGNKRRN